RERIARSVKGSLRSIKKYLRGARYDIVILDEILSALSSRFTTITELVELIKEAKGVELVLTGRSCPASLLKKADYISCIKDIKHPFRRGVEAREGIEY
ncbi:cob(I)yrinic acid a,c-diamide adenosyltransferase, partial [Candidatus Omnitrophota bacterium]